VTEDGAIAAMRSDGSVVVFVEDVFFEKLVTFQVRSRASCIFFPVLDLDVRAFSFQ
jgi:hypothetical protein